MSDDPTPQDAPKPATGRPSKYDPKYAKQAEKLCSMGATDIELADFFEVSTVTIWRWRSEHDDFCKAVIAGKDGADDRVERAFYNRAVGYTFESEKVFQFQGQIVRADTREHVPPDPGAALNWLKNRRPEKWRDKQVQEIEGTVKVGADDALAQLFSALDAAATAKLRGGAGEG
jgi:hypothetical protein